jgi:mono/diheme cytochrome c family protein
MRVTGFLAATAALAGSVTAAVPIPGDARRGAELFESQKCVACHAVNGKGGTSAPDLGRTLGREFTPSSMAATLWNHAPAMWQAMEKAGIERPRLTPEQAADLFAFFYSARYFEKPGDAGRGKAAFAAKGCAGCHDPYNSGVGPEIAAWEAVTDPVELARQMWNHAPQMKRALAPKGQSWPTLTPAEMNDVVVYLQNLPATKGKQASFAPASAETGERLFQLKGCAGCHVGGQSLAKRKSTPTVAEFAAGMWNHAAKMNQQGELNREEMRRLVGYLWSIQNFAPAGDARRGRQVFTASRCGTCHGSSAPGIAGQPIDSFRFLAGAWMHGPAMQSAMKQKSIAWPRLDGGQVADLMAYLSAGK